MRKQYPGMDPIQTELLVEACRIVDQLEVMHDLMRGDRSAWMWIKMPKNAGELILVVDQIAINRRALQVALKTITATLTTIGGEAQSTEEDPLNEIGRRIAERQAAAQGR